VRSLQVVPKFDSDKRLWGEQPEQNKNYFAPSQFDWLSPGFHPQKYFLAQRPVFVNGEFRNNQGQTTISQITPE